MPKIEDMLIEFNPWWKGRFSISFSPRTVYSQLKKFMEMPQIIALSGLRRVGKTTIMLKLVEDAIEQGVDPKNIIYFSFDEFHDTKIREILNDYQRTLSKNIDNGRYLLLLDEIQKLDNWADQVKTIYDMHKGDIKIVVSGSESLFIKKRVHESLAGRIFEFEVRPLSFSEFIAFKGRKINNPRLYKRELLQLMNEHILTLGFPELIGIEDKEKIRRYVVDGVIEKIVYRDIPQLFRIDNIGALKSLVNILIEEPGQMLELTSLAADLNIDRHTLANYLSYLEESQMIKKLYNYSKNKRKTERKLKKYYPAVISPDLLFKDDDYSRSKVFEWYIVMQLCPVFFWRDASKNEVDIVLDGTTPIEVKYGKVEVGGLLAFLKKFDVKTGYIVSYDKNEEKKFDNKKIVVEPSYLFLLKALPSRKKAQTRGKEGKESINSKK